VAELPCPTCSAPVTVWYRSRSVENRPPVARLWFTCPYCSSGPTDLDPAIAGLPSDTSALITNWRALSKQACRDRALKMREKEAADSRARALLRTYLDDAQKESYDSTRIVRVPSRSLKEVSYELEETECGARVRALVQARVRPQRLRRSFGLTDALVERFEHCSEGSSMPLCLHPTGGLPPPDQVLALKLFVEVDEARAWHKGSRYIRGLPPEPDLL